MSAAIVLALEMNWKLASVRPSIRALFSSARRSKAVEEPLASSKYIVHDGRSIEIDMAQVRVEGDKIIAGFEGEAGKLRLGRASPGGPP